ncbi:MAG: hypothetical protein ACJZ8J_01665 [Candidatus Pelagibacter sp.]
MRILKLVIIFIYLNSLKQLYAADVEISGTQTTREDLQASSTLTISGTLDGDLNNIVRGYIAAGNEIDNATVVVESNGVIQGKSNAIMGRETSGLTVTNSGTIEATSSKAIQLQDSQNATITNKSGGLIFADTNAIVQQSVGTEDASGASITNAGTIYSVENRAIYFYDGATDATFTNESGGIIYNTSTFATVQIDTNSTLVNSGTIDNRNSPSNAGIAIVGNNNTITLKDKSILVGKIDGGTTSGNTLKFQHGVGQGYFYETAGSFTLQDLDGNQVVKGSAGSVGQGGSETLDELLSYKSLNIRQFINRYKDSENLYDGNGWGETYSSFLNRNGHASNLALEYDLFNIGANLISPLENLDFILAFEAGVQDFEADHKITYQNVSAGLYLPSNKYLLNLESFILGGVTLKESERTILTNTTSSGKLNIDSNYQSFEVHSGVTKTNSKLVPNVGLTGSFSITPSYDESKYYSWRNRKVANVSVFFSDKYNLINNDNNNLNLGWLLDFRNLVGDKSQVYSINGTSATYKQDNALTREISLVANLGYEKKITDNGKFTAGISAKNTNQDVKSLNANFGFKLNF